MLKKILGVVAALVVVLVGFVASRPGEFAVVRSAVVAAPRDVVFARVDGLRSFDQWSPWAKLDPTMKTTLSGPETGKGARYEWAGNDQVGSGNMTITSTTAPSQVVIDLNFTAPFAAENVTTFDIVPDGEGSKVTWTMTGHNNFAAKAFSLAVDMDKTVGGDFEKGLASLKALAEKDAAEKAAAEKAAAEAAAAAAAAAATATATATATDAAPH